MLDLDLIRIKGNVCQQKVVDFMIGGNGILRYQGRIHVPDIDGLRERIMVESHESRYAIHPYSIKMYHDVREFYC